MANAPKPSNRAYVLALGGAAALVEATRANAIAQREAIRRVMDAVTAAHPDEAQDHVVHAVAALVASDLRRQDEDVDEAELRAWITRQLADGVCPECGRDDDDDDSDDDDDLA